MLKWQKARHHGIPLVCVCEEDSTEHPCFLEPSEPLHDSDRLLDPLFGVQVTRTGVRRGEVAISAQPILDTHTEYNRGIIWDGPLLLKELFL